MKPDKRSKKMNPKRNGLNYLDYLIEEAIGHDQRKHDHVAPVVDFHFDEESRLLCPETEFGPVPPLSVEEGAYKQLFRRLGRSIEWYNSTSNKKGLPADYLLSIPDDLRAELLNRHLADFPGTGSAGGLTARGYDDVCRAIMSSRYAVYDNSEALELFRALVVDQAGEDFDTLNSSTVTRDSLYVRSIWKETGIGDDGQPDQTGQGGYGIGVYFGNNETGGGSLIVRSLIQRHACTNSIVSNEEVRLRHIGDPDLLTAELQIGVARLFEKSADMLRNMVKATMTRVPSFTDVLAGLADENGWSQRVTLSVAAGTENQNTVAGLVNGVTWAAHEVTENQDDRLALEVLGGEILERGSDEKYRDNELTQAFARYANRGVKARKEERVLL
jgi:hypothetical protein